MHVATIHVDKAFDLHREHESAAQYHTIHVEPGTYPVEVRQDRQGRRYIVALFSGTCTASGYGPTRYRHEEGKPSTVARMPYKYLLRSGSYLGHRVEIHDAASLETADGV